MNKLLSLLSLTAITPVSISVSTTLVNQIKLTVDDSTTNQLFTKLKIKTKFSNSITKFNNGWIYFGEENCGAYRSTDGINFTKVNGINFNAWTIAMNPYNNYVYILSYSNYNQSNGIYCAKDGINFFKIDSIPFNPDPSWAPYGNGVTSIAFSKNGDVFVSTFIKLYKSTDGINFKQLIINSKIADTDNGLFVNDSNGKIFYGGYTGLYSSDDGVRFSLINSSKNIKNIVFDKVGNIYLTSTSGTFRSTNGTDFTEIFKYESYGGNINVLENGFIYFCQADKGYVSKDNGNNFIQLPIWIDPYTHVLVSSSDGNVYSLYMDGLKTKGFFESNDGINFKQINTDGVNNPRTLVSLSNGSLLIGTDDSILGYNMFLTANTPDYNDIANNQLVYKNKQTINIKPELIKGATLDGNSITVPSTDLEIKKGQHTLILNLKDEYKSFKTQVTYKFLIKTAIDPTIEITYQSKTTDTDLLTGLVSNTGNTNSAAIIQTRAKPGTSQHPATLGLGINSDLIDLNKSYFIAGTVDGSNNFTENGTKQTVTKNWQISTDGIYHLYLVDFVGNTYESYLELGENNWLLTGSFNDTDLTTLSGKLNVTVNLSDPTEKQVAMVWLQNYKSDADKAFKKSLNENSKGFDISINNLSNNYKTFLFPVIYTNSSSTKENINWNNLNNSIKKIADFDLQNGLNQLPQNLNVDTSKVVNKLTLDSYSTWINKYQDFINQNKENWNQQIEVIVSRGFASDKEKKAIETYIKGLDFSHYLKQMVWQPNDMLKQSLDDEFSKNIELNKLEKDVQLWTDKNLPEINNQYLNALKTAESNLNLHGYTIKELLGNNQIPQTKSEIENYKNSGQSYHNWLQSQANAKYGIYQWKMGLGIGLPVGLLTLGIGVLIYWRFSKKFNPYNVKKEKTKI